MKKVSFPNCTCTFPRRYGERHEKGCPNGPKPVLTWYVVRGCRIKTMRRRDEPFDGYLSFAEAKAQLVQNLKHDILALEDELRDAKKLQGPSL